jgi:hypothetical protein
MADARDPLQVKSYMRKPNKRQFTIGAVLGMSAIAVLAVIYENNDPAQKAAHEHNVRYEEAQEAAALSPCDQARADAHDARAAAKAVTDAVDADPGNRDMDALTRSANNTEHAEEALTDACIRDKNLHPTDAEMAQILVEDIDTLSYEFWALHYETEGSVGNVDLSDNGGRDIKMLADIMHKETEIVLDDADTTPAQAADVRLKDSDTVNFR